MINRSFVFSTLLIRNPGSSKGTQFFIIRLVHHLEFIPRGALELYLPIAPKLTESQLSVHPRGIQHVYIKPRTPQFNWKAERSHRTDETEFYQLLIYTVDGDLNTKLEAWENFYNYDQPHIYLHGKTPYEVM